MKVAILAGGLGTRLSEETTIKPKPMVEVGGIPMLMHIMNIYAAYGFNEFVIALGYKGEVIKDFFLNYRYHSRSLTVKLDTGEVTEYPNHNVKDWTIHLLDTGLHTQTGGRVKRIADFIGDEPFCLTYGDGVCGVNIQQLVDFHNNEGKLATLTAVRPPARFGRIDFGKDHTISFEEKPQVGEGWINGGYFVLEPEIVNYIQGDETYFEREPLEHLAADGQLNAYQFNGFWQCMDTLRDVQLLESMWQKGNAPWLVK